MSPCDTGDSSLSPDSCAATFLCAATFCRLPKVELAGSVKRDTFGRFLGDVWIGENRQKEPYFRKKSEGSMRRRGDARDAKVRGNGV